MIQAKEVDGRKLWLDPEVEEFVKILEQGHPVLGWEGDPQLGLFRCSGNRWEIARFEQGRFRTVCRSKPGAKLDLGIIIHLMEHDLQRRTAQQLFDAVEKHNASVQAKSEEKLQETVEDAVARVYFGLRQDVLGKHAL